MYLTMIFNSSLLKYIYYLLSFLSSEASASKAKIIIFLSYISVSM